ncbi:hypothetical protein R1flu_019379 [Riccia fluitans]|uniref:Protein kinase domain-containing protein n=1 Tax=Riccia fluitans TaxID=41844 RepID=A0ABD1ZK19_9MARC
MNTSSSPGAASGEATIPVGELVGIVVGVLAGVGLSVLLVYWIQAKLKPGASTRQDEKFLEHLSGLPPRFSYEELVTATHNFSKLLGAGGFGTVYEGLLATGVKVAVKKLHSSKEKTSKSFRSQMLTVGGVHHKHLVKLLGFCAQGSERLLVYEFVPNDSLDKWLFSKTNSSRRREGNEENLNQEEEEEDNGEGKSDLIISLDHQPKLKGVLTWNQRFSVALGTAKGLAYLHDDCGRRIVHLDIKPQNILLDQKFEPKVVDFGLCKLTARGQKKDDSNSVVTLLPSTMGGTPGYTAPEWILGVGITEKGDVYSYGMVLFELISGRSNIDASLSESMNFYFPALASKVVMDLGYGVDCLMELADGRLEGNFDSEEMMRVLKVAMWCVQDVPKCRPEMREVVLMLEGKLSIPDPPPMKFSGLLQAQRIMKDYYESHQILSAEQIEKVHSFDSPSPTSLDSITASEISLHSSISSITF